LRQKGFPVHDTPALVRIGLLLPLAGGMVSAGAAAAVVPTTTSDWATAGTILAAAVAQVEITRRTQPVRRDESAPTTATAMASVWSLAAAIAVHLTLAIALMLVLHIYLYLRAKRDNPDDRDPLFAFARNAGVTACSLIAAHFVASSGAWTTASPHADTGGVLMIAAAGIAHLAVNHALTMAEGFLRHRRLVLGRAEDLGLEAALLTVGAIAGALASSELLAVLVAIPVIVTLHTGAHTRELEDDASLDKKTGLATAATWQANAERVFQDQRPAGVLMVDLDHFKRLNDTYGHHAGDDVLAAVGACLRSQLRQADLGGRFGGEEFTVLLADTNIIDTMTTAERIRVAISELRVDTVDNHGRHTVITDVTASIGAATYPHHGATVDDCLRVADSHVYEAKQQGRNMVVGIDLENLVPLPAFESDHIDRRPGTRAF
jgi:diguanylate cyclase (GGDEF)-like protein